MDFQEILWLPISCEGPMFARLVCLEVLLHEHSRHVHLHTQCVFPPTNLLSQMGCALYNAARPVQPLQCQEHVRRWLHSNKPAMRLRGCLVRRHILDEDA